MQHVTVESAIALDATQTKSLETLLAKKLEGKLDISYVVNKEILGGLRVTVDSRRYDVSLSGKLEQISKQI